MIDHDAHLSLVPIHTCVERANGRLRTRIDEVIALMSVGMSTEEARQLLLEAMAPRPVIDRITRGF